MDPSPPPRTYCLGYVRVSTHLQDISLEAQTEHITRAALYHNGGAGVDEFFEDADTSGSVPFAQREGGQRLLAAARQAVARGENVTVIVPKLDRLGRDTDDVRRTVTALDALGDPGDRTRPLYRLNPVDGHGHRAIEGLEPSLKKTPVMAIAADRGGGKVALCQMLFEGREHPRIGLVYTHNSKGISPLELGV